MVTPYTKVYSVFFSKITDDMYMELTPMDTEKLVGELLASALPWFEFPRVDLSARDEESFAAELSDEEINIIAIYMIVEWLGQQLASIENVRLKYSSSDFKFTSQANHMAKVQAMKNDFEQKGFHLQRLYKRRKKDKNGILRSTFSSIMED